MDNIQKTLLTLIKSALTGEKYSINADCLKDVFKYSVEHHVANMAYYGAANCGVSTSCAEMIELFPRVCKRMVHSQKQTRELEELFLQFDEAGIDYMPLKGTILKTMYPKPDMRTMGDADVLIRTKQYDAIEQILKQRNFGFKEESENELVWDKADVLHLELHRYLVAPSHKDLFDFFGDVWESARSSQGSKTRYEMSPEDTFLFLFIHFAKHYRSGGIGIRQAVDLWLYRQKVTVLDEQYIKEKLEALNMYRFYANTCEMLAVWFENKDSSQMSDFLTNYIFSSGNFGTRDNYAAAQIVLKSKNSGSITRSFFNKIKEIVFLPYKSMCEKYKVLKKAPYLLPIMWFVRAFNAVFIKKKSAGDYNINTKGLDQANAFNKALEYVGADFEFNE